MLRLLSLLITCTLLCACGNTDAQSTTDTTATTATAADLALTEKGRVPVHATLTITDGPFAGTHELVKTKENRAALSVNEYDSEHVAKHHNLAGLSQISALNLTTADGSFGIANGV